MKKANIAVCVFFIVALAALTVFDILSPAKERSETENRELAQLPAFSPEKVFDGSFTKEYESYVVDQFTWRDGWIRIKSATERALGKTMTNGVYFADDGYYIEHKSRSDIDLEQLEKNIGYLESFYDKVSDMIDGETLVAIAPTASVILSDKLPRFNDEYAWNDVLDRLKSELGEGFVDLREVLDEHKDEYIYYRTDHHWTSDGAYYAYTELMKHFGIEPLSLDELDRTTLDEDFFGTVIAKLNIETEPDIVVKYEPKTPQSLSVSYNLGAKLTDTLYDESKLETRDKYAYFLGGNDALVEIETGADTGRILMLAKDSYANCMISLLTAHFDKLYVVDLRYFNTGVASYIEASGDVTDALVLYNISGFADERSVFKLAR